MSLLYSKLYKVSHHCKDAGALWRTQWPKSKEWQPWPWPSRIQLGRGLSPVTLTFVTWLWGTASPSKATVNTQSPEVLKEDLIMFCKKKNKRWQFQLRRHSREGSAVSLTVTLASARSKKPPFWPQPHAFTVVIIHLPPVIHWINIPTRGHVRYSPCPQSSKVKNKRRDPKG